MLEKLYRLLLKLYPSHFRRAYGDEALHLVLDRARDEKGFWRRLRLWFDLLLDLVVSLPREHWKATGTPMLAAKPVSGEPSFHLLTERSPNPALLFAAVLLTAATFWACVIAVARSRMFPAQFAPDSYSLQALVQSDVALVRSAPKPDIAGEYSFCLTAPRDVPNNSLQPLMRFDFATPGASGTVLMDGKIIQTFANEQRLWIHSDLQAGDHRLILRVDRPAENASIARRRILQYCSER